MTRLLIRTLLPAAWLLLAGIHPTWAQGDPIAAAPSRTVIAELGEQIDRRAAELEKDPAFDEATRAAALQRLEQGRTFLTQALADLERTEQLAEERADGPALEAAARAEVTA
ncbi:MAG TPA: hypothetical protein VLT59_12280, partial [Steroidobacteraceae bacterium]|nr:hypothetical protein [Steroidobacteraceae bacterium]